MFAVSVWTIKHERTSDPDLIYSSFCSGRERMERRLQFSPWSLGGGGESRALSMVLDMLDLHLSMPFILCDQRGKENDF